MPEPAALVTGAAQGIGEAIARRLARDGICVCVADLDRERADAVAADIGGIAATVDVRNLPDLEAAARATADAFGTLSILVNNAGMIRSGMLHKLSDEDWELVQDVNLRGAFNGFRAVAPRLRDGAG
jgi:3-oxoacyl-[acyl-carrier protein] reductase